MSNNAFEKKINSDFERVKKDFGTLGEDGMSGLTRMVEERADDVKKTVTGAVKSINKDVGLGLRQYNSKIQEVANRLPGGFGKKMAGYPWVTITISMIFGLVLGVLLKPGRLPVEPVGE